MAEMSNLEEVVAGLRKAWGHEWRGPCPNHSGQGDNFVMFGSGSGYCHSQCGFVSGETLGLLFDIDTSSLRGITVESFLAHFKFPRQLAEIYRLEDRKSKNSNRPYISIPYLDKDGSRIFERYRYAFDKSQGQKFDWQRGAKPSSTPFGLQWWDKLSATGILVAGETDQMATQLAGVMSLGIPGDNVFSPSIYAPLTENISKLYIWAEQDDSSDGLVAQVVGMRGDVRILTHPKHKDPAEFIQREGVSVFSIWLRDELESGPLAIDYLAQVASGKRKEILDDESVQRLLDRNQDDIFRSMAEDLARTEFAGDPQVVMAGVIAASSRGMVDPIALYYRGQSSSGKTFAVEHALKFVDPDACINIGASSAGAWIYRQETYQDKAVFLGEVDSLPQGDSPIASAVRAAMSKGLMVYETTSDTAQGRKAFRYDKGGNFALLTTGTRSLESQTNTRMLTIEVPDGKEQINLIGQKRFSAAAGLTEREDNDWNAWHMWSSLVDQYPQSTSIKIPFAKTLWDLIPASYKLQSRLNRDSQNMLTAITTVAKMRSMAQEDLPAVVEATLDDYAIVREAFGSAFSTAAGTMTAAQQDVFDWVDHNPESTTREIFEGIGTTQQTAHHHLSALKDIGLLAHTPQRRNRRWTVIAEAPDGVLLPTEHELSEAWSTNSVEAPSENTSVDLYTDIQSDFEDVV